MSSENTEPLYKTDALINSLSATRKPIAFLVGSPLSMPDKVGGPGVPGVNEMIAMARARAEAEGLREQFEKVVDADGDGQPYQRAMGFLRHHRNQGAVNDIVRQAVLKARLISAAPASPEELDGDHAGWHLPSATRDLGALVASAPRRFGPILTTNFDPLIKFAIRSAGGRAIQTLLHSDGSLDNIKTEPGDCRIVHLHGYWVDSDTLHTQGQLTTERPQLVASLLRLLREHTLLVIGYGGWDDVFTRALVQVGCDSKAEVDILWAFYESEKALIRARYESLFSKVAPVHGRGWFRRYGGVDCHEFFKLLRAALPTSSATEAVAPSPLPVTISTSAKLGPTHKEPTPPKAVTAAPPSPAPPPSSSGNVSEPSPRVSLAPPPSPRAGPSRKLAAALPVVALSALLLAVGVVATSRGSNEIAPGSRPDRPERAASRQGEFTTAPPPHKAPRRQQEPPAAQPRPTSVPERRQPPEASPSEPSPTLVTNGTKGVDALRAQHQVSALPRGPVGIRTAQMPAGTFGFIPMDHVPLLLSASILETPSAGAFEVHRSADGTFFLVGYAHEATVSAINTGRPADVVLLPSPGGVRTNPISLPFGRIRSADFRSEANDKLLLLGLTAAEN